MSQKNMNTTWRLSKPPGTPFPFQILRRNKTVLTLHKIILMAAHTISLSLLFVFQPRGMKGIYFTRYLEIEGTQDFDGVPVHF